MLTFDIFFDRLGDIDWLGVLVATLAAGVLSYVWYSLLFGKAWASAQGRTEATTPEPIKVAWTLVTLFLFNVGIAYFIFDDFEHALVLGLIFGVLFIAMALYTAVIWSDYPFTAFIIDAVYWILVVVVSAFVQGLFI